MTETATTPVLAVDRVTEALRKMILDGSLAVGVQLKQEALAQRFGVSRLPINQALKRLQSEGLVQHVPYTGSVVASKSVADLLEILDIRIGLETRALQLAIPAMKSADFSALEKILKAYEASDSPAQWTELNLQFHLRLYAACARPKLLQMIEDLVRSIDIQLRTQQSHRVGLKASQDEHRAIVAACRAKDAAQALALLQAHIEHTQNTLRQAL
nr:GntR family transcriptional regulator [Comamonas koreensis]